ncbi:unnamed protein product [Lactuca saligna]|uniref:Uncharacterized protein n=1 Tax=Lactuca saligna TaxID=75948 RepID=A0AA35VEN7_LACSI|nr:unnamed protein product [Lactuca saligna]
MKVDSDFDLARPWPEDFRSSSGQLVPDQFSSYFEVSYLPVVVGLRPQCRPTSRRHAKGKSDQKAARWFVARLAIGGGLRGSTRLKKKKKNDRSSEAAVSSDEKKETKQRGCSSSVLEGVAKENEMAARPDGGRHLGKKMERL